MEARVQKWGNSLGLRIPKSFAREIGLEEGTSVEFNIKGKELVVRPKQYDLKALLSQVTSENRHEEIDTDGPVGREIW